MNRYTLTDGVAANQLHPNTFFIPTDDDKNGIVPGDFVKAAFTPNDAGHPERMWVKVTAIHNGAILGTLANTPFTEELDEVLSFDDMIELSVDNVLNIMHADDPRINGDEDEDLSNLALAIRHISED